MNFRSELKDEGLWFRPLLREDLEMTHTWRMQERVRSMFHDDSVLSFGQHLAWFESYEQADSCVWIFGDADGPIGQASLYMPDVPTHVVTFGRLIVSEERLGQGFAKRATRALCNYAFRSGFQRVVLDVKRENDAAIRVYESVGFKRTIASSAQVDSPIWMHLPAPGALTHTVIVGSYNRPKYIAQTLQSVLVQTKPNWEMIVSDDASSEQTVSVIEKMIGVDPRCRLIHAPDRPPPGPRPEGNLRAVHRINDALRICTGDIIHYVPDDDFFAANRFSDFDEAFADPLKMTVYGRLRYLEGRKLVEGTRFPGGPVTDPHCMLDHSQVAHRRETMERVPEWPSDPSVGYSVDGIFFQMLVEAGYGPIWPMDRVVGFKRMHAFNMQATGAESDERRE